MVRIPHLTIIAVLLGLPAAPAMAQKRVRPSPTPAAPQDPQALIALLRSDAPPQNKAIACKQLAVYGGKDAVPALAGLLSDEPLACWARIGLEAIADPAADEALRQAAGKLQGKLLVGVINSIAVRRDAQAVDLLVPRLKDADPEVAAAAAVALGRIGGQQATTALEQSLTGAPAAVRSAVAEGCILCAERLLSAGKHDEATRLYDLVRKADVPKQRVAEATRGAILARQAAGVPLLVEQLRSADKSMFAIGLRTARELPGSEVTGALIAELGRATPDRQALLILALADRGDAAALPVMLRAAKSGSEGVRIAAIRVLGRLRNASSAPVLLEAATEAGGDVSTAAIAALADIPGKEIDDALLARLAGSEGAARQVVIQLAGERRITAAVPALRKAADDADAQVRAAAITALGFTIEAGDLPVLIARVANPPKPEEAQAAEDALRAACVRMADREACAEKLVAAMSRAPAPIKCKFLEILGAMGGARALRAVGAAAKDAGPEIQDAASRLLGEWMTADAAPVLLDLAKTAADGKYRTRALRGYIRIARQLDVPAAQRVAMCREALQLSQRDDERKLVLDALGRYPSAEGLSLVLPHVRSGGLKAAASAAAVAIGQKIVQTDPAAVAEGMKQVLQSGAEGDTASRAQGLLDQATKAARDKK